MLDDQIWLTSYFSINVEIYGNSETVGGGRSALVVLVFVFHLEMSLSQMVSRKWIVKFYRCSLEKLVVE